MLKGLRLDALEKTWQRIRLTPGARELVATMRAHGALTALVSGGFSFFTGRVADAVGFDMHRSNSLLDDGAALTGAVGEPILDRDTQARHAARTRRAARRQAAARRWRSATAPTTLTCCEPPASVSRSTPSRSSRPRPRARVDHADLRALLFAQGYRAAEFVT